MKTVVMIPYWHEYQYPDENLDKRDDVKVGGYTLIERAVRVAENVEKVNDVIIYASNESVLNLLGDSKKCTFQKRDRDLDSQDVSIEDIIERFLIISDADVVVLMHPRCPFIKAASITECIEKVMEGGFDSAFVASLHRKLAWFNGKPLNYSLESGGNTQHLSSIEPIILESSAVYVFTRELFENTRRRIGESPYMKFVGRFEGFEINSVDDYEIAELIVNAGLEIIEH